MNKKRNILTLNTISKYIKIVDTGRKPFYFQCNDMNFYYVKHPANFNNYNVLFYEYLANYLFFLWELDLPRIAFINVKREHTLDDLNTPTIQYRFIDNLCFGSEEVNSYSVSEMNNLFKSSKNLNGLNFLKIALFDIWVANIDRNKGNPNILIQYKNNKINFIPIDHDSIFDPMLFLDNNTYITQDDTILAHEITKNIVSRNNIKDYLITLNESFLNFVKLFSYNSGMIFEEIPLGWNIDKSYYSSICKKLLNADYVDGAFQQFEEFLFLYYKKK